MKSLLRAIAAALRSMARYVLVRCAHTGDWILQLVTPPAAPALPTVEDLVPEEAAPDVDPYECVRQVADDMYERRMPSVDDLEHISDRTIAWLRALDDKGLRQVAKASADDIRAHIRGKKSIRGLLQSDPETVAAYVAACRRERADVGAVPEPVPAYG